MNLVLDQCLKALADAHRRQIVRLLMNQPSSEAMPVSEVLAHCSGDPDTVRLECQHVHFPKLDSYGLIEWDRHRDLIAPGPQFEVVVPLLTAIERTGLMKPAE